MTSIYKLKAQLVVLKDIEQEYGSNRSVGNIIANIESIINRKEELIMNYENEGYKVVEWSEEDERIRKEIVGFFLGTHIRPTVTPEQLKGWIDWLEKQRTSDEALKYLKENHSPSEVSDFQEAMNIAVAKAYDKGKRDAEKQCEQKPIDDLTQQEAMDIAVAKCFEQGEQKSDDKVEPKFKVKNWYQCTKDFFGKGVTFDKNTAYYCAKEGCLQNEYGFHIAIVKYLYDNFKLWTIQDAKDGDVLACNEEILLFKSYSVQNRISLYCWYNGQTNNFHSNEVVDSLVTKRNKICPATKEQRDLLFAKMKEAGYEWDEEKKELKKIEEEYDGEDYGIDSLFHAQRILERTLGEVKGYQTDDGILAHKCAITAVKDLARERKKQKPVELISDDELYLLICKNALAKYQVSDKWDAGIISRWLENRLKSFNPQQKTVEWSEKDDIKLIDTINIINDSGYVESLRKPYIDWLKSLKQRIGGKV